MNQHLYAPQVTEKLTDEKVADTSRALGQLGALTDAVYIGPWADPSFPAGARGYIYQMLLPIREHLPVAGARFAREDRNDLL